MPDFLRNSWRAWRTQRRAHSLILEWREVAADIGPRATPAVSRRLAIVPSDTATLTGARGDEAMMLAAVQALTVGKHDLQVAVLTATTEASQSARSLGFVPIQVWNDPWSLARVDAAMTEFAPDAVLVVGADVLDGSYDALTAIRMLAIADLAVRRGARGRILGFSFSTSASRHVAPAFDYLIGALAVNVRDEISMARFQNFSKAKANLVADIAFLLRPDTASSSVQTIRNWIEERTAIGHSVLGINLHPMLTHLHSSTGAPALVDSACRVLEELLRDTPLSVVLLAHDYRGSMADGTCLTPIYERLKVRFKNQVLYPSEPLRAAQLKGIVGYLHGVLAGRMHLAIATLGMGVPVAALTYQDKFEGLFQHFNLPNQFLLNATEAFDAARLRSLLVAFIDRLPDLQETIRNRLGSVEQAAARNLQGMLSDATPVELQKRLLNKA
jgi:polysaccharide pyruvyl transferase WcaK-like protein